MFCFSFYLSRILNYCVAWARAWAWNSVIVYLALMLILIHGKHGTYLIDWNAWDCVHYASILRERIFSLLNVWIAKGKGEYITKTTLNSIQEVISTSCNFVCVFDRYSVTVCVRCQGLTELSPGTLDTTLMVFRHLFTCFFWKRTMLISLRWKNKFWRSKQRGYICSAQGMWRTRAFVYISITVLWFPL